MIMLLLVQWKESRKKLRVKLVIAAVKEAGYTKVVLRPLMVVAGGSCQIMIWQAASRSSWKSMFEADGGFESVDCQVAGLGRNRRCKNSFMWSMLRTRLILWEQKIMRQMTRRLQQRKIQKQKKLQKQQNKPKEVS